ncbi:hypothetical protein ACIBBB_06715 [Streptomyces sp. NPDC051217]|uniref:hypothetical protein n=1 Tax=Streptomyces sp. NPDC051217 TaxID=3365644 RepID=UPI003799611A
MAALSEIKALLGESRFNWSDPVPWIELERELGIELPADFRELWRDEDMVELVEFLPSPVGSGPGELIPVATATTGEAVFLRVPDAPSSPWRVVVQEFDSPAWTLYKMTFSEWLPAYLKGLAS